MVPEKEFINCLYCNSSESQVWAVENGYTAVKCGACGLVYVNPRPVSSLISEAVKTGVHADVGHGRTVIGSRLGAKVIRYQKLLKQMFPDVWASSKPVSWIDVGAGYGELVEAIKTLAPVGSTITGLEPMRPKAEAARARGLNIQECYLSDVREKYDFLSLINVYSHIPDFRSFLKDAVKVMTQNGEMLIETGNTADLRSRSEVPGDLDLPDHLVFAGETHLTGYLKEAGFSVLQVKRMRIDGMRRSLKNLTKKLIGRKNIVVNLPYTSAYRSLLIRARLNR